MRKRTAVRFHLLPDKVKQKYNDHWDLFGKEFSGLVDIIVATRKSIREEV